MELALATVYINILVRVQAMPEVWAQLAGANIQLVPVHKIMRGAAVLAYCLAIVLINILVAEQI